MRYSNWINPGRQKLGFIISCHFHAAWQNVLSYNQIKQFIWALVHPFISFLPSKWPCPSSLLSAFFFSPLFLRLPAWSSLTAAPVTNHPPAPHLTIATTYCWILLVCPFLISCSCSLIVPVSLQGLLKVFLLLFVKALVLPLTVHYLESYFNYSLTRHNQHKLNPLLFEDAKNKQIKTREERSWMNSLFLSVAVNWFPGVQASAWFWNNGW